MNLHKNNHFRYYRKGLSAKKKGCYDQIYDQLIKCKKRIVVQNLFTVDEISDVLERVLNDNPELFYIDKAGHSISFDARNHGYIDIAFIYDTQTIEQYQLRLDQIIAEIRKEYKSGYYRLIQRIVRTTSYSPSARPESYTIIGSLLMHSAVCEGYSKALKYLCDCFGLDCIIVSGDAINVDGKGPHAWNLIKVDDKWFHVDTTWNEISGYDQYDSHLYLCWSDDEISGNHFWDRKTVPVCDVNEKNMIYVASKVKLEEYVDYMIIKKIKLKVFKILNSNINSNHIMKMISQFKSMQNKKFTINVDALNNCFELIII